MNATLLRWSVSAALVCLALLPQPAQAQQKKPNVIIIITDDLRWDCMSCAGHKHLKTPNLDRLAAQGVRFKNAFCTTSLCSPSRASILSGTYAHRHGVRDNFTEFPAKMASPPQLLRMLGYLTAYIGKWHMGEDNDAPRPGFDYWASHKGQGKYFDTEFNIQGRRQVKKGYYTHVVTDMAIDWLKQQQGKQPFLLMLGHKAPHSFYVPEAKYTRTFDDVKIDYPASAFQLNGKPDWIKQRLTSWHGIYGPLFTYRKNFPDTTKEGVKDFAAMIRAYWGTIESVDDSVGKLLDALRDLGILDDTIIIFCGDNGLLMGEHGMVDKRTMHEPSIRVPMLLRYPPLVPVGQPKVIDKMVLHIDMAPSVLDMCGSAPADTMQGKSWKKLLQGDEKGWRTSWMYEYNYEKQFPYTPNVRGVRTDDWVYMHYPHGDGKADRHLAELYNLKADPDETKNLIDDPAHFGKLQELRRELVRLRTELNLVDDRMPLDEGIKQTLPDPKIR